MNDYYDVRIKRQNLMRLTSGWPDKVAVYEGDCSDADFVAMVFEREGPIRRIVHLAARAGVRPSIQDPFIYIQSNLHATTRLLEYARTAGCDSFVYASSSSVYGEVRLARESSSKKINYFEFGVQLNNPQHDPDAIPSARMNPPNGSTRWTHSVRQ